MRAQFLFHDSSILLFSFSSRRRSSGGLTEVEWRKVHGVRSTRPLKALAKSWLTFSAFLASFSRCFCRRLSSLHHTNIVHQYPKFLRQRQRYHRGQRGFAASPLADHFSRHFILVLPCDICAVLSSIGRSCFGDRCSHVSCIVRRLARHGSPISAQRACDVVASARI